VAFAACSISIQPIHDQDDAAARDPRSGQKNNALVEGFVLPLLRMASNLIWEDQLPDQFEVFPAAR
jgi:hypothetical protein